MCLEKVLSNLNLGHTRILAGDGWVPVLLTLGISPKRSWNGKGKLYRTLPTNPAQICKGECFMQCVMFENPYFDLSYNANVGH